MRKVDIVIEIEKINRSIRKYYVQLCANNLEDLDEMPNYPVNYNAPKPIQKEAEMLMREKKEENLSDVGFNLMLSLIICHIAMGEGVGGEGRTGSLVLADANYYI